MSITIQTADEQHRKEWDDVVESSSHGTLFHTWKWLNIVQRHTNSEFLPLVAYKGTQLIAIYPVFIQKKGIFKLAFSPPSQSYLLYLGPVIREYDTMKQDKKESLLVDLQEAVNTYLFSERDCKYIRIRSSPGIYDSRFFTWTGFSVEPQYTYRINLSGGIDAVWASFDRKLRVDINKAIREKVEVRQGDYEDLLAISELLSQRFREQGFKTNEYRDYLTDLYNEFHPENFKIFIAYHNGQRAGGMISLCFKQIMYLWIGVPKSKIPGLSPNDLVQWEAIQWASENGYTFYEEMDGGDRRLRGFKAKYNPELVIWYTAVRYRSSYYRWIERITKLV